jgi:hypothetical protein
MSLLPSWITRTLRFCLTASEGCQYAVFTAESLPSPVSFTGLAVRYFTLLTSHNERCVKMAFVGTGLVKHSQQNCNFS